MVHEVGETARSAIDVFKTSPFTLSMVLINFAMIGYLYYQGVESNKQRSREMELLYQNRKDVGELLAQCIPQSKIPDAR